MHARRLSRSNMVWKVYKIQQVVCDGGRCGPVRRTSRRESSPASAPSSRCLRGTRMCACGPSMYSLYCYLWVCVRAGLVHTRLRVSVRVIFVCVLWRAYRSGAQVSPGRPPASSSLSYLYSFTMKRLGEHTSCVLRTHVDYTFSQHCTFLCSQ